MLGELGVGSRMQDQSQGTVFIGRDRELEVLLGALDNAASGAGRLVLIGGAPGIGKTRLADELARTARERGDRVLWGRCWEDAGTPPYWPWIQALRSYLRATDADTVRRQMGDGAADIAQILPELHRIVPALIAPVATSPESARFRLFDSAAAFLVNASTDGVIVLVIDDLHAADATSILFLRFLVSQIADSRILVVATYRDMELEPDDPRAAVLVDLRREPVTRPLTLGGLAAGAVGQIIEATSSVSPSSQLVSLMWRVTAGNPLYLGEAVRLLGSEGGLNDVSDIQSLRLAVPAAIRDVIARRVSHFGDATTRALRIAAALGPEFGIASLERIGEYGSDEVIDLLDPAIRAGLLVDQGAPGRFRFFHDLVRQTLYEELTPAERIRLHRRIAQVLEDQYAMAPEAHLAELAYHFFEGARGGDAQKAVAYAERAGRRAGESLAYEEAARLYRMALAALDAQGAGHDGERCELLLLRGDADARADDLPAAREAFLMAAEIARRTGAGSQLARAALGYGGRFIWARVGRDPHLIPLLEDALVLLGGSEDRLAVRLLARLACAWRSSTEHRGDCAALTQQALELARRLDDPATLSYALVGRYWAMYWPENPHERLEVARDLLAVAEGAADFERTVDGHWALYVTYSDLAMISEAKAEREVVRRAARELRQPAHEWAFQTYDTVLALLEGAYERAEALVADEARPHDFNPIHDDVSTGRIHRFLLRREQGRVAEEEASVRASVDEFPWYPYHRAALVCLLLDLSRTGEAQAAFDELARNRFEALYRDCEWLLGVSLASEACSELADTASAEVLYAQLQPFAGRHAVAHAEGSLGVVDRYLGLLATTLGRLDDAERHFSEAIRLNEKMGATPWTAHVQADFARMLVRRNAPGDDSRAREFVLAAGDTARRLGMTALVERLQHQVEAATVADTATAAEGTSPVFRRDGDYWAIDFGRLIRLRDAKGLRYIAALLASPGREFHALDLVARLGPASEGPARLLPAGAFGLRPANANANVGGIDEQSRTAYRTRLRELQTDLDEAESFNDPARAERAQAEIEALEAELSGAYGLGGRARAIGSPAERARQSVTKAIKDALRRIELEDPALGDHLARSIHTGAFCVYDPDPAAARHWRT
jgi:hypothetical protein